jgi:hypothetical protein
MHVHMAESLRGVVVVVVVQEYCRHVHVTSRVYIYNACDEPFAVNGQRIASCTFIHLFISSLQCLFALLTGQVICVEGSNQGALETADQR